MYAFDVVKNSEDVFPSVCDEEELAVKLGDVSLPLVTYLARLYLFPSAVMVGHWQAQVYSLLHTISKCGADSFPCSGVIQDNVIKLNRVWIEDWYNIVVEDCRDTLKVRCDSDYEEFRCKAYTYVEWLSNQLSSCGFVSFTSVQQKLTALFLT